MNKEEIVNDIYSTYGSDSRILFGIKERDVVKAIVEFTLNRVSTDKCHHCGITPVMCKCCGEKL